jgi:predicted transposase/invertase (TIGR01784 family)
MYDSSLKYKWDNKNVIDYAKEEAREEGREEGEHKKAVFVAIEMKKEGFPFEQITKFTGLSIAEIEKL